MGNKGLFNTHTLQALLFSFTTYLVTQCKGKNFDEISLKDVNDLIQKFKEREEIEGDFDE